MTDPVDLVASPPHYTFSPIEVIDAIEAWGFGFHLGSVTKYIVRAGRKDPATELQDLHKAKWFLERYIALKESQLEGGSER